MTSRRPRFRGYAYWPVVVFLLSFVGLLILVSSYYLLPATEAASAADPTGKKQLAAYSRLLLAIVLTTLVILLLLVFRVRRLFFPRPINKPTPTAYSDAWAESAKRVAPPAAAEEEET